MSYLFKHLSAIKEEKFAGTTLVMPETGKENEPIESGQTKTRSVILNPAI
jgi:hypothetical protein